MLFREQMAAELAAKTVEFRGFLDAFAEDLAFYMAAAAKLENAGDAELAEMLAAIGNVGALPSGDISGCRALKIAFSFKWDNHEQARRWAHEILDGRTTFAADGSQIYAAKKTSVPVAAVQIGWFENPHDESVPYGKGVRFEVMTPADLFRDQEDPMNPDVRVEERRYRGEIARIAEFLESKTGWEGRGERMPVAFFDNPLLVPFSQKGMQNSFLEATVELVELSKRTRVPVVGYVDRSFSRDLLSLLGAVGGATSAASGLYDAAVVLRSGDAEWGDRTCYFYSTRRGLEAFIDPATGRSAVGFCYLKTSADGAPARLDVPAWAVEAGLLDEIVDVVRAECVVGLGYPYALESADQAAVISGADREAFFRALQEFANREKLDFSVSRKDESKQRRR